MLIKVLADRLKLVVSSVISETHTTFVKGKKILDRIFIANEMVDEVRKMSEEFI